MTFSQLKRTKRKDPVQAINSHMFDYIKVFQHPRSWYSPQAAVQTALQASQARWLHAAKNKISNKRLPLDT
jgi:hypothetical protein